MSVPPLHLANLPATLGNVMYMDTGEAVAPAFIQPDAMLQTWVTSVLPPLQDLPFTSFDGSALPVDNCTEGFDTLLKHLSCHSVVSPGRMLVYLCETPSLNHKQLLAHILQQVFGPQYRDLLSRIYNILVCLPTDRKAGLAEFAMVCAQFALWFFATIRNRWIATDYQRTQTTMKTGSAFPLFHWPEFLIALRYFGDTKVVHKSLGDRSIDSYLKSECKAAGLTAGRLVMGDRSMCDLIHFILLAVYADLRSLKLDHYPSESAWASVAWNTSRDKMGRNLWVVMGVRGVRRANADCEAFAGIYNAALYAKVHRRRRRRRATENKPYTHRRRRRQAPLTEEEKKEAQHTIAYKAIRWSPTTAGLAQFTPELTDHRGQVPAFLGSAWWQPTHRPVELEDRAPAYLKARHHVLDTTDHVILQLHYVLWQLLWLIPADRGRIIAKTFGAFMHGRGASARDVAVVTHGCGLHMVHEFAHFNITPLTMQGFVEYNGTTWRAPPLHR
jgi:hypothetical protein